MDLSLNLSQKQMLSVKMQQSAEILQMNTFALSDYLQELSTDNPVIEWEEEKEIDFIKEKLEWLESFSTKNTPYFREERQNWDFSAISLESLQEHLLYQAALLPLKAKEMQIVSFLAESVNQNGYLEEDILNIIEDKYNLTTPKALQALQILQGLEPTGVGARNLQECLLLQLAQREKEYPIAEKIIKDYLEILAKNQLHTIAKKLKVKIIDVVTASDTIKELNPKPGSGFFTGDETKYVIPDAFVFSEDGIFRVVLNQSFVPKMKISSYYMETLSSDVSDGAKEYISGKIKQAQWAMTCVEKREQTLLKTVTTIVSLQQDFFIHQNGTLVPMKLTDISKKVEVHESTISRAIKDKYLQCEWGIFPLSHFFSTALISSDHDPLSSSSIKEKIADIISREDKSNPHSDREITETLNSFGIQISRRTVAKYRESMNILGHSGRKKF